MIANPNLNFLRYKSDGSNRSNLNYRCNQKFLGHEDKLVSFEIQLMIVHYPPQLDIPVVTFDNRGLKSENGKRIISV